LLHAILAASAALGAVCLVFFAVNAGTIPRLSRTRRSSGPVLPKVSVVIPARNEARDIEAAVRSHLAQDYPDLEVIVVDDRSTDATPEVLARLAAADARLCVVRGVEPPPGWMGKPHALYQGVARAGSELVLLADADVRYDPPALREAVDLLVSRRLDLITFFPRVEMKGFWENVLMPYLAAAYMYGPAFVINSDVQKRFAAGGGSGMLVRRDALDAAGGYEALRESVIDDIGLAIRVRRSGGRCRMVLADDRVRIRMYRGFREVVDGFTKNIAYVFEGWTGALLAFSTMFSWIAWTLPFVVLVAGLAGAPVPAVDLSLAAIALALVIVARIVLALFLGYPLWPAVTHPLLATVWMGIAARSFAWRFLRRRVLWRGRHYDSARARF
jgi:chlorobactene glucosyltransferase